MEKTCTKCGATKPLDDFHRNSTARDGRRTECKACMCERTRNYYAAHLRQNYDTGPTRSTCRQCRAEFEYMKSTGPRRAYCSERCRYAGGEDLKKARAPEHVRRCGCGSTDVARVGRPVCHDCKKDKRGRTDEARARERRRILRLYNIDQDYYVALVVKQKNRCAVCRTDTPGGRGQSWAIDHDHQCCPGKGSCGNCVRGLLCNGCNLTLGYAGDDSARLHALANYIENARQSVLVAA